MSIPDIKRDDMGTVYVGMAVLFAAMLCFLWMMAKEEIVYAGLKWTWYQFGCFKWIHLLPVEKWQKEVATLAATPTVVSISQFHDYLNRAGNFFVILPIALAIYGVSLAIRHPSNKTRRRITAATLPLIMSRHSPAVTPVLHYGDLLNTAPPEQRSSLNPEEWVAQHSLLVNESLDRPRCLELLSLDLGTPVTDLNEMAPHEKTLFAVFGARLLADGNDHGEAQVLLDRLNRSCNTSTWKGQTGYPDLSITDSAFAKYASDPKASQWLAIHPYPRTLLHAMHKESLAFGRLPSSHFRWLKGMDRKLWYALNTTGRKSPFIESAAVFTQALWERFAFDHGYRLEGPCLNDAVDGVEKYLVKVGLLRFNVAKE